jgi:CTP:molybdopterin cytidylyltransferase MocA
LIAAIILAAGKSERMGGRPKALLKFRGKTFLEHVLAAVNDAGITTAAVVVGHHKSEIAAAFPRLSLVFNPDYEQGMSTSVQAGLRTLPAGIRGAGIFLVDHPLIDAATVAMLARELVPGGIVVPVCQGRRGHPVFFGADLFDEVLSLGAGQGLNIVVRKDPSRVTEVAVANSGVLLDVDTLEELENLLRGGE